MWCGIWQYLHTHKFHRIVEIEPCRSSSTEVRKKSNANFKSQEEFWYNSDGHCGINNNLRTEELKNAHRISYTIHCTLYTNSLHVNLLWMMNFEAFYNVMFVCVFCECNEIVQWITWKIQNYHRIWLNEVFFTYGKLQFIRFLWTEIDVTVSLECGADLLFDVCSIYRSICCMFQIIPIFHLAYWLGSMVPMFSLYNKNAI